MRWRSSGDVGGLGSAVTIVSVGCGVGAIVVLGTTRVRVVLADWAD
jgi:hypothetical protein